MMNPSVADFEHNDPTISRCESFAKNWGFGSLYVANTFAYRITNSRMLLTVSDPVGPANDRHILEMASKSSLIVLAYGKLHKRLRERGAEVCRMLTQKGYELHALMLNADGSPRHPLYIRGDAVPTKIPE